MTGTSARVIHGCPRDERAAGSAASGDRKIHERIRKPSPRSPGRRAPARHVLKARGKSENKTLGTSQFPEKVPGEPQQSADPRETKLTTHSNMFHTFEPLAGGDIAPAANLADDVGDMIPGFPQRNTRVLRPDVWIDPADLARLREVSRGMRDAVVATGRQLDEFVRRSPCARMLKRAAAPILARSTVEQNAPTRRRGADGWKSLSCAQTTAHDLYCGHPSTRTCETRARARNWRRAVLSWC